MDKYKVRKIISSIKKRVYRLITNIPLYFKGKPITLIVWPIVLKIAFKSASKKFLKKEAIITQKALEDPSFSEIVVKETHLSPFIVASRYIRDTGNTAERLSKMISFSIGHFHQTNSIYTKTAISVIENQISDLVTKKETELFKKYKKIINCGFFNFQVPAGFMHGDFHNQNAIIKNNKLYLIDWEYATANGSILYDWWYLRRSLNRFIGDVRTEDYERFCMFIENSIQSLNLNMQQFDAFGHAMHAVIDFSRLENRGGGKKVLKHSIKSVRQIVKAA